MNFLGYTNDALFLIPSLPTTSPCGFKNTYVEEKGYFASQKFSNVAAFCKRERGRAPLKITFLILEIIIIFTPFPPFLSIYNDSVYNWLQHWYDHQYNHHNLQQDHQYHILQVNIKWWELGFGRVDGLRGKVQRVVLPQFSGTGLGWVGRAGGRSGGFG